MLPKIEWTYDGEDPIILIQGKREAIYLTEEEARKLRDLIAELLLTGPEED